MNPTGKHRPKKRHPGEGTVVHRKDRWRAKPWAAVIPFVDTSGRRRETWLSAASRAEAEALRRAAVAERDRGLRRTTQTVGEYVSAWLDDLEVGPGTMPRYRSHLKERIAPSFGTVELDRLTPQMVRRAVIDWAGSPATRAGALRLLRAAMRQAVTDRAIEHDPTAGIPYPRSVRKRPVTLTGPQARQLIAAVKGERFGPILVVSLGLGLRRGEAIGLRTQDVDLKAGTVTISKSLRYIGREYRADNEGPYRLTATKTGDERTLPLPAFVAETLRLRIEERDAEQRAAKVWAPNDLVFCDPVGNSVPLETLRTWYLGALKRAGLPPIRWHSLRGTCATLLIEMGVDLDTVRRVLGHKDLATTLLYIGETPSALEGAARRLGEAIG